MIQLKAWSNVCLKHKNQNLLLQCRTIEVEITLHGHTQGHWWWRPTNKYIEQSVKGFLYLRNEILYLSNINVSIAGMKDNLTCGVKSSSLIIWKTI